MAIRIGRFLEVGTVRGEPLQIGDRQLIPLARTLSLSFVGRGARVGGGFVWVHPTAVEVVDAARSQRVPIPDVGRRVQVGLVAAMALAILARAIPGRRRFKARAGGSISE